MKKNKIKKLAILAATLIMSVSASAVPAVKSWQKLRLSNGTFINVMKCGDEHGHWFVDEQGNTLSISNGITKYFSQKEFAEFQATRAERITAANQRRISRLPNVGRLSGNTLSGASFPRRALTDAQSTYTGKKKGIVILVNFADKEMSVNGTQARFDNMFNQEGYNENKHIGSVHDYFYDQSYGQFDLTFDVVGPVTLSHEMKYYGENESGGNDKHACSMVSEAIVLTNALGVDFSQYDWNGDHEVDQVFLVYAGYGENFNGSDPNTIWPHEFTLAEGKRYYNDGNGAMFIDGVRINTYAVSSELTGISGFKMNGIGLACHEFSHCLGYPDIYDTTYSGGSAMGNWDVLDGGSYVGPDLNVGQVPSGYTAYERWMAGWMTPTVLDSPCDIEGMPSITKEPQAYIIYNDANKNEAYMLENRQNDSWDKYVGGTDTHGLLITHIDYDRYAWNSNSVNSIVSHQRMTYMPADNNYGTLSGGQYTASNTQMAGDPFPGSTRKTSFTDETLPAAKLFNRNTDGTNLLHKPITNIKESDETISFTFMGGEPLPEAPLQLTASNVTANGFTASWEAVKYAKAYTINLYDANTKVEPVITESCSGFKGSASGGDLSAEISDNLDNYTETKGWTGSKIYEGPSRIKIGSSRSANDAYITTPTISAPADGCVTVSFDQTVYGSDTKYMTVNIVDATDAYTSIASEDVILAENLEDGKNTTINFSGITKDYKVRFTPRKRAYIYGIKVFDGEFTKDNIESLAKPRVMHANSARNIIVSDLTDTQYTFTDITSGSYLWRVKAVSGKGESEWSTPMPIEIKDNDNAVQTVTIDNNHNNKTYNLNGQLTHGSTVPGIYIKNGKKVIVK